MVGFGRIWPGFGWILSTSCPVTWLEVVGDGCSEWFGAGAGRAADLGHDLMSNVRLRPEAKGH